MGAAFRVRRLRITSELVNIVKTNFFSLFETDSEGIRQALRELDVLAALPEGAQREILRLLKIAMAASPDADLEKSVDAVAQSIGRKRAEVMQAINAAWFLTAAFRDTQFSADQANDLAEDIVALLGKSDLIGPIRSVVAGLKALANELQPELERVQSARGILPSFVSIRSTVEMRAVQRSPYRPTSSQRTHLVIPKIHWNTNRTSWASSASSRLRFLLTLRKSCIFR